MPWYPRIRNLLTPLMKRLAGGCHWNRDTASAVTQAGFQIEALRHIMGGVQPGIVLRATRPERL